MKNITLYHYAHCPYCIRVRLTLGLLSIPYQSIVLRNADEKTPIDLIGKKMVPIIQIDGKIMPESLDIMKTLDQNNQLDWSLYDQDFQDQLSRLSTNIHAQCMPHWIYTIEFNQKDREYFQKKKEAYKGPFQKLVQNRAQFEAKLNHDLALLENQINPFYKSRTLKATDLLLASHLWGMYHVPEFQFSPKLHQYLQNIKKLTNFNQYGDFSW